MKTDTGIVGQFAGRMARLKEQRQAAQAEAERAAERLKELGTRRARLASAASSGEKGAAKEIAALVAALDEESASVSRTKTVAEDSVRGLNRLVMAAEVRHHEEAKRLARGRYEALCKERYRLDGGAEEAMSGLVEVLDRLESLHVDQVRRGDALVEGVALLRVDQPLIGDDPLVVPVPVPGEVDPHQPDQHPDAAGDDRPRREGVRRREDRARDV